SWSEIVRSASAWRRPPRWMVFLSSAASAASTVSPKKRLPMHRTMRPSPVPGRSRVGPAGSPGRGAGARSTAAWISFVGQELLGVFRGCFLVFDVLVTRLLRALRHLGPAVLGFRGVFALVHPLGGPGVLGTPAHQNGVGLVLVALFDMQH